MSIVDEGRIEDLERIAHSLADRVDVLEHHLARGPVPARAARHAAPPHEWSMPGLAHVPGPEPVAVSLPSGDARAAHPHRRLEDLLGGKMLAWLGGVAIVVGIALFFLFAVSRGWIGESARVLGGGVGSLVLLGTGVWLHERRGRTDAARTMVAVAIAGLFMTVVVASRVYAVIPVVTGLGLALAVGVTGAAVAVHWNAKVIGALGIIGGLLAPVVLAAPENGATLAVLLIAALSAVAVLLWRRWEWLGFAVLLVCAPQWLTWLDSGPSLAASLAVLVAFGALGHIAAIGFELRMPASALRASSTLLLVLNAVVLAIAGQRALSSLGHPYAADLLIAALGVAHVTIALLSRRMSRVSADIKLLLLTIGVLLSDVAFALLVPGPALAIGWAATGVLFARVGARRYSQRHERALSEAALGAHIAGALLVAIGQANQIGALGQSPGDQVTATIVLGAVAAAAFTCSRLIPSSKLAFRAILDATGLGTVAYLTAINLHGAQLVVAVMMEAGALAGLARRTTDDFTGIAALTFLAGGAIYTLAVEAPPSSLVLGVPDGTNSFAAVGACALATLVIAQTRLRINGRELAPALFCVAWLAALYLGSVLIITVLHADSTGSANAVLQLTAGQRGQMLLSGLWGISGVSALILGLRRDHRLVRQTALGVLLVTAGKVFLYDLSTLDSVYRIASFIGLGLLLLAGAYAYQRLRPPSPPDFRSVP